MSIKSEIILINITGEDKPGITTALTGILGQHNATILDIGQANIHKSLSLAIMFETKGSSGEVLKDLLFKTSEQNLSIRFSLLSPEEYSTWVSLRGKDKYIITILGKEIKASQLSAVTQVLSKYNLNIERIIRLTKRIPLEEENKPNRSCLEMSVRGNLDEIGDLQKDFLEVSSEIGVDIALQRENTFRRVRRLICFDMDSTLIQTEVIDELAERAGVGEEVRRITESAMNGEIDFKESFKKRVSLLKGLDESVMKDIAESLPITEGLDRLIPNLKKIGYKIAIISGGFTYFGNYIKDKYNLDYVFANDLEIENGKLTGKHLGEIIDANKKAEILKFLAQVEKIDLDQTIAVGDGANDLLMLSTAGLGIAFHAKPTVKANAEQSLSNVGIDGILYFLGYRDAIEGESN